MPYTLDELCRDAHDALKATPYPAGRIASASASAPRAA